MGTRTEGICLALLLMACGSDGGSSADEPDATPHPMVETQCDENAPDLSDEERALIALPADSWWQAPNTPIRPHCPGDRDGCGAVITAWSGGAFDANHNRMLIFGGGHADYSGNEVYAFDIGSLSWTRLTDPSPPEYENQDPLPDGQPVSRHSYDGLVYLSMADKMLAHGGSRWRDGSGTGTTWTFDATDTWDSVEPMNEPSLTNCCSEGSAYDSSSGRAFFHVTSRLMTYDPATNAWEEIHNLAYEPYWPRYEIWGNKVGTFDSSRGLVWFFGEGLYMVINAASGDVITDDWVSTGGSTFENSDVVGDRPDQQITTGGAEVITANAPGVGYNKSADSIVAWSGGAPWILDLMSKSWRQGSAEGAPATQSDRGTYGRWRYIERTNVFILVNDVDEDVSFYKHTAGCGGA